MAKKVLDGKNVDYAVIDAEENPDLVNKFGIRQAPTLVVVGTDGNTEVLPNVSNIIRFVNTH